MVEALLDIRALTAQALHHMDVVMREEALDAERTALMGSGLPRVDTATRNHTDRILRCADNMTEEGLTRHAP